MAYVYELIDKQTGKWYVGSRTSKTSSPDELGMSYFSSSRVVSPLFKANPARFETRIIVVSDPDYVAKVEVSMLELRGAKDDPNSYNMTNGSLDYSPRKVGELHALRGTGVCGRTMEQKIIHGAKGAAVSAARGVGIFSEENKLKAAEGARRANAQRKAAGIKRAYTIVNPMSPETRFAVSASGGKMGGKSTSGQRYRCLHCGMISAPGPLGVHQAASNHVGKEKIT